MSKTKEIPCVHYICHGKCEKGREAEQYKLCQTCPDYVKKPGAKPARIDNRRKKLDKIRNKEFRKGE